MLGETGDYLEDVHVKNVNWQQAWDSALGARRYKRSFFLQQALLLAEHMLLQK